MTDATAIPLDLHVEPTRTRREMLIGGACSLAAITAFAMRPRQQVAYLGSRTIADMVPLQFASWSFVSSSGLILPPKDQLQSEIYSQLLTRTYVNQSGTSVMLLIAYSPAQDGVVQIHRPEVCYPAGGFKLVEIDEHETPLRNGFFIPSRYIVAETPVRREKIMYWTRVGKDFPRRWSEQRWAVFEQNLHGQIPDGLLVRMSSTDQGGDAAVLDRFASDLYQNVGKPMRQVLVGSQAT